MAGMKVRPDVSPYDALLFVSFGGPERPEDVVPFLENVTRGRGIPRERLEEVGEHYFARGGKSPINDQNREFLAALRADLAGAGIDLPVYWGNRNWDPYLAEAMAQMKADGVRRAAVLTTSAYASYSSCRQYRENLYDAAGGEAGIAQAPVLDKLRHYFNHPGFVEPLVDGVLASLHDLPEAERNAARIVFVTHSIPEAMNAASGPPTAGGAYVAQHLDLAKVVAARVAEETGLTHEWDLAYCSRSGAPHVPWLEPDINDHLEAVAAAGVRAVVICPIGFVSDHMEVVHDLDTEALDTCQRLGLLGRRSATAGSDPRFVGAVRDLLLERAAVERGDEVARNAAGALGPLWDRCPVGCCAPVTRVGSAPPTLCGVDSPQYAGEPA